MKLTKSLIRAKIKLALSLLESANVIMDSLREDIPEENCSNPDVIFDFIDSIFDNEYAWDDTEGATKDLVEILEYDGAPKIEDGKCIEFPSVHISYNKYPEISVPVDDGELIAYTSESDYNTKQMGIGYRYKGSMFDLAFAEIKKGELAKLSKLPKSNKDIDLYVYADISTEDFTNKYHFSHKQIKEIADDEE